MTGPGSSCGACKFLRRRCSSGCVFAPYFCYDQAASNFAAVHKVFGASNVSKMLLHLPVDCRGEAALAISYEAIARMQNPKYGCVAQILTLQQQVENLKQEIENFEKQMSRPACEVPEQNTIDEIQFSSKYKNTSINNYMNQNIEQSYLEDLSLKPFDRQTTMQHPPTMTRWEDEIILPSYDTDIYDLLDGMEQNIYLQHLLMNSGSIYH
nr:LOB domain-containing protein 33-like [Ipomoea batatas]